MKMEKIFYYILVVGLALIATYYAGILISEVIKKQPVLLNVQNSLDTKLHYSAYIVSYVGKLMLSIAALYWLPKTIKKLYPEMS